MRARQDGSPGGGGVAPPLGNSEVEEQFNWTLAISMPNPGDGQWAHNHRVVTRHQAETFYRKCFKGEEVVHEGKHLQHEWLSREVDIFLTAFDELDDADSCGGKKHPGKKMYGDSPDEPRPLSFIS